MRDLTTALASRRAEHLYRQRAIMQSPQGVQVHDGTQEYLSFCSNDYLGLANHPAVIQAAKQALDTAGMGSGAAHLVTGHHRLHHELEDALAEFTQRPRALLFSTGYMANLAVVSAFYGKDDVVFEDRLNHASLVDAGQLSAAQLVRYQHNDMLSLSQQLQTHQGDQRLIVSDGVFSMDGDQADVHAMHAIAQQHAADIMIDDAHGIGVIGREGRGVLIEQGLDSDQVAFLVGTLGKAFGTFGAFVAGNDDVIEMLIQTARPYIYTTALPPAIAAATLSSLELVKTESWRREKLRALMQQFRNGVEQLGLSLMPSDTPIQPLLCGDADTALRASEVLREAGIWVTAIRPPTVPLNRARLRFTFSAAHEEAHVDRLLGTIEERLLPLFKG